MRLVHPDTSKTVEGVTNRHTLDALREAGWKAEGDEPAAVEVEVDEEIQFPARNASRAAWASVAARLGVAVPEDATRNQIRDQVEALVGGDDE